MSFLLIRVQMHEYLITNIISGTDTALTKVSVNNISTAALYVSDPFLRGKFSRCEHHDQNESDMCVPPE